MLSIEEKYLRLTVYAFYPLLLYVLRFLPVPSGLLHNETARAKLGDVQSFYCDAYSLPAAHSQHQQNMHNNALIMR